MTEGTERLSLGEVEAITKDALVRAGALVDAAIATAWSVRAAERNGERSSGLQRVGRLIEGLRMSAIDGAARPVLNRTLPTLLTVDAAGGLSDYAISSGFETLIEVSRSYGMARLLVTETGDRAAANSWLGRLSERRAIGALMGGPSGSAVSFPNVTQALPLPDTLGETFLRAASGVVPRADPPLDLPFTASVSGALILMALQPMSELPGQSRSFGTSGLSAGDADLVTRRHQADTEGVNVPSELLVSILTA
ncbi:MAG: Ldh family oxidoreductase [Pseudomonadota bacterium]